MCPVNANMVRCSFGMGTTQVWCMGISIAVKARRRVF